MATQIQRDDTTRTSKTITVNGTELVVTTSGTAKSGSFSVHDGPSAVAWGRCGPAGLRVDGGRGAPPEALALAAKEFGLEAPRAPAKPKTAAGRKQAKAARRGRAKASGTSTGSADDAGRDEA